MTDDELLIERLRELIDSRERFHDDVRTRFGIRLLLDFHKKYKHLDGGKSLAYNIKTCDCFIPVSDGVWCMACHCYILPPRQSCKLYADVIRMLGDVSRYRSNEGAEGLLHWYSRGYTLCQELLSRCRRQHDDNWNLLDEGTDEERREHLVMWLLANEHAPPYCSPSWSRIFSGVAAYFVQFKHENELHIDFGMLRERYRELKNGRLTA